MRLTQVAAVAHVAPTPATTPTTPTAPNVAPDSSGRAGSKATGQGTIHNFFTKKKPAAAGAQRNNIVTGAVPSQANAANARGMKRPASALLEAAAPTHAPPAKAGLAKATAKAKAKATPKAKARAKTTAKAKAKAKLAMASAPIANAAGAKAKTKAKAKA